MTVEEMRDELDELCHNGLGRSNIKDCGLFLETPFAHTDERVIGR